jgi:hypothetical protein
MEDISNLHSADGSFLGFLYQIERAIFWLSGSHIDAIVGVEVDDDITIKLIEGKNISTIYEQAKHSQTNRIPYSNQSLDLWKTLKIWIDAVESGRINVDIATFSLITNKKMPSTRLVYLLNSAKISDKPSITKAISELKDIARKLPKTMVEYANSLLNCSEETLIKIVNKIVLLDNDYKHNSNDIKRTIRGNLSMSDDLPFNHIYNNLLGFVSDTLIQKWKNREAGWITVKAFNQQYSQLVADFKRKSFYEQTVDSLPVSTKDVEKNKGRIYVEQLNRIGCSEEEVIEAIHDFIRAASERSRLAQDGEISSQKFDLYFQDLLSYWKAISRPQFKFAKPEDYIQVGYQVYYDCIVYKGKLNSYEPEQGYTHKGSYHYLSDKIMLGWHPQWENLKAKKNKNGAK